MAGVAQDPTLKELIWNRDVIEDLPLNKFYEVLNHAYYFYDDSSFCDILIRSNVINSATDRKYCYNLLAILEKWDHILKIFQAHIPAEKCCEYLNYWIYDKINGNRYRYKSMKLLYSVWDMINKEKIKSANKCWHKNFNISENEFKRKKDLYVFLELYDTIKRSWDYMSNSSNKPYCDYIKDNFKLYYSMKHEQDICGNFSVYTDELLAFEKKFKDKLTFLSEKCPDSNLNMVFNRSVNETTTSLSNEDEALLQRKDSELSAKGSFVEVEPNQKTLEKTDVSQQLGADEKYKKLNRNDTKYKYCKYCEGILTLEMDYPGISVFCAKITRNLKDLSDMLSDVSHHNDRCSYFVHWLYDELFKMFSNHSKYIHKLDVFNKLLSVGYKINNELREMNCMFTYDPKDSVEVWKEKKHLHDYFKGFDNISCDYSTDIYKCQKHCEYIAHTNELYGKYINGCCTYYYNVDDKWEDNCAGYFECDKKYNPYKLYAKFNCENGGYDKEFKEVKYVPIDGYVKSLTTTSYDNPHLLKLDNSTFPNTPEITHYNLTYDPFYVAILIAFALLGIFLGIFVFYKFTPLGSWFDKRQLRKKRIEYNYHGHMNELLHHDFGQVSVHPKKRLRISYHSS
ncbi:PIR Superfamily Protein [Plasmodium ovale curtisi]|uniref:PIR Superfamily Protein n=1 Tax=Plasmodium ovale curtisi TaxID=864141 RepID=A0A1A8WRY0_PLAOA|nr:PIR Superfamily Protein [Plasmodium ovale curtisi]